MKRFVVLVLILAVFACALVGCNDETETVGYNGYFKNFVTSKGVASVTESLALPSGVSVYSYDSASGYYVIIKSYKTASTTYTRYGLATATKVVVSPKYESVLAIRGDFAIVVKPVASVDTVSSKVGVVSLKNSAEYGFSYVYTEAYTQIDFLSDKYLIMMADKTSTATTYSYATIYDYTTANGLLEVSKVVATNDALFKLYDNYLSVVDGAILKYYDTNKINSAGYCEQIGTSYEPYTTAGGFSAEGSVKVNIFYAGNGWFVESCVYASTTEFDAYEQTSYDDNGTLEYYYVNRATRYNASTNKRLAANRVTAVANSYSTEYFRDLSNYYNNTESNMKADGLPIYYLPVISPSEIINAGYSIVYYNYYYYGDDGIMYWAESFELYDSECNAVTLDELMMPILYVDGRGMQNSDPAFRIEGRNVEYFSYEDNSKTVLEKATYGVTEGGELLVNEVFDPIVVHDGMLITYMLGTSGASMLGAYNLETGKLICDFDYMEFTIFMDGYATCSKAVVDSNGNATGRKFYRISKNGVLTELSNVYALKNGMYITKADGKYGLCANDGTVLLPNEYDSLSVIDSFLVDGEYVRHNVTGAKDGKGIIFKVETKA